MVFLLFRALFFNGFRWYGSRFLGAHLLSRSGTWFTAGHSGSAASASSTAVSRFGPVYPAASPDLSFRLRISVYGSTSLRTGRWQRLFLQQSTNNRSHCISLFLLLFLESGMAFGRRVARGYEGTASLERRSEGSERGTVQGSGGFGDGNCFLLALACLCCLIGSAFNEYFDISLLSVGCRWLASLMLVMLLVDCLFTLRLASPSKQTRKRWRLSSLSPNRQQPQLSNSSFPQQNPPSSSIPPPKQPHTFP